MELRAAAPEEFETVRNFYWEVIDLMQDRKDTVGWKKGVYPAERFLSDSIAERELYVLDRCDTYVAAVILNNRWNKGYEGVPWSISCSREKILVPHALAVHPKMQGRGIGKTVVKEILDFAGAKGKRTVRLDILSGNIAAERLYTGAGFHFVQEKEMYYDDTGWTGFRMYEYIL